MAAQLNGALTSRIAIEQAKGILAERAEVDMQEAFSRLRRYARDHNRQLSVVATELINGTLPGDGDGEPRPPWRGRAAHGEPPVNRAMRSDPPPRGVAWREVAGSPACHRWTLLRPPAGSVALPRSQVAHQDGARHRSPDMFLLPAVAVMTALVVVVGLSLWLRRHLEDDVRVPMGADAGHQDARSPSASWPCSTASGRSPSWPSLRSPLLFIATVDLTVSRLSLKEKGQRAQRTDRAVGLPRTGGTTVPGPPPAVAGVTITAPEAPPTTLRCRNSTDPTCGPFRWDPPPGPISRSRSRSSSSPTSPRRRAGDGDGARRGG